MVRKLAAKNLYVGCKQVRHAGATPAQLVSDTSLGHDVGGQEPGCGWQVRPNSRRRHWLGWIRMMDVMCVNGKCDGLCMSVSVLMNMYNNDDGDGGDANNVYM